MQKEAFEATGLIPRSIIRTFERFLQQLLPGSENIAIREYRLSRYQIRVSMKSLFQLICIPILVNYTVKPFLVKPVVQYVWDSRQEQLFLNHDQQKQAFRELHNFSETLFFDALLQERDTSTDIEQVSRSAKALENNCISSNADLPCSLPKPRLSSQKLGFCSLPTVKKNKSLVFGRGTIPRHSSSIANQSQIPSVDTIFSDSDSSSSFFSLLSKNEVFGTKTEFLEEAKKAYQVKSLEIAERYNTQSILAITNVFGDLLTFATLFLLLRYMRAQIVILQSFVTEFIYSLSDTSKSFLLILGMDLLVGFHSPRAWELALQALLRHIGLPLNENFILLFVALFPVFLDTVFKYWIFRYLNKISPSTVVTYHSMLE